MQEEQQDTVVDYLRRVTAELRRAHRRIEELETDRAPGAPADDPVAVVGMGCRLPGDITSPDDLWRLVDTGTDAVTGFPADRGWDLTALLAESAARGGGFLGGADAFDAEFFGISPREAATMDPQQRLFLEVAWEALENAGIDPQSLRGSRTGVYAGTYQWDSGRPGPGDGAGHVMTGTAASVLSGRLAYVLGLEGPALTVDTACSSSLVALHTAVQALRTGESELAVVGGVTVLSDPAVFTEFSRQGGLAPDGRCKAFSADADGTGWSEGVAVLVVERLSDARRHGHPVLALVRGTAVNSDGASNGLTAPSGRAQQQVILQALAAAGLTPADVDAVEAHGTGTRLGDPVEASALLATYGQDRERPLLLGSLKSNIGHTQAAAGVAGVIKTVLAMRHGRLPRTLHADEPTGAVEWTAGRVELLREPADWPRTGRPRRAAVSAFGISGTNAHVVLEAADALASQPAAQDSPLPMGAVPWPLSARDADALADQVARVREAAAGRDPLDVGHSLATGRSSFEHRAVLLGSGEGAPPLAEAVAGEGVEPPVAVLFSGQGSQRPGMGRELAARFPVFAAALDEVLAEFDHRVRSAMWGEDEETLHRTEFAQPALFAVEVALYRLVLSWGVRPEYVMGHSVGEIAAAHVAGVLSLPDACRLVSARARLMQDLPAGGAMVAVAAAEDEVRPLLTDGVVLGAVNGPRSVVLSGPEEAVDAVAARLTEAGHRTARLRVSHAFHSPLMDPALDPFRTAVAQLSFAEPALPVVSNVTGRLAAPGELTTPDYWVRHLRETVRFADGVRTLAGHGVGAWLEVGPGGVLAALAQETLPPGAVVTPLLHGGRDEEHSAVTALSRLYVHGVPVDFTALFAGTGAERVALPTYPFRRDRFPFRHTARDTDGTDLWSALGRTEPAALAGRLGVTEDAVRSVVPALLSWRSRHRSRAALDALRHREHWQPHTFAPPAEPTGPWLLLLPEYDDPWAGALAAALGTAAVPVRCPAGTDRATLAGLLRDAARDTEPAGVLCLTALGDCDAADVPAGLLGALTVLQATGDAGLRAPVWCATRDAVAAAEGDRVRGLARSAVRGLGRVAAREIPDRWGGLLDLPADDPAAHTVALALAALTAPHGEDEVAVRATGALVRRLVPAPRREPEAPTGWRPAGTTLVTGGTGGLGAQVAHRLAAEGAERLLLVSRRGPEAPGADDLRRELAQAGCEVEIAACDVADRDALAALLAAIPAERPLTAVVHAAGVLDDGVLDRLTPARFAAVFRAKTTAALHLDELTRGHDLSAFVLFSSVSGALGNPGQANYAAANTVLDALAARRRAEGLPAVSIAWAAWRGAGMAAGLDDAQGRRSGLGGLDPELALTALLEATTEPHATLLVADLVPLAAALRAGPRRSPVLDGHPAVPASDRSSDGATTALADRLRTAPPAEHATLVLDTVRAEAAAALGHRRAADVPPDRAFRASGFDSLTAVELRNRLVSATGLPLTAAVVFDHPTPRALADHVLAALTGTAEELREAAPGLRSDADDPVVIVGMACRLPGGADSPQLLWDLLAEERDAIGPFPGDRGWDLTEFADEGRLEGGFLYDAHDFDAAFFGISPREAVTMDPQQRLLLETAWEAVERAGIDPHTLRGTRTGVFVGSNGQDYAHVVSGSAERTESHAATGLAASALSGRVSYTLGLNGPAVTVDTACSSSLVALHQAVRAVRAGECALALAGGVTVMTDSASFARIQRLGAIARDGRSKAFSEDADGTGYSEGAALLVVERLSEARRRGHRVRAVIRGSAVNQDGASNGLTAPNGPAQQRVIREALADAGLTPADVDAVEAHGTGTRLGDPIEAEALLAAYGPSRGHPLLLGSVKSNLGHTQAAAGAVGVIKTVLALEHGRLPRTLHADTPSTRVDWTTGAVELLRSAQEWPDTGRPRRAAVSAFGISGTNAHLVLEQASSAAAVTDSTSAQPAAEAAAGVTPPLDTRDVPLLLSARTAPALAEQAARTGAFLRSRPETEPAAAGWSLATTRAAHEHRAVLVGHDRTRLLDSLDALAAGTADPAVVRGTTADSATGPVFVFPGQGSQWWGMGRELYDTSPVFRARVDDCADALAPHVDFSPVDLLRGEGDDPDALHRADVVQPALFSTMVALAALWRSLGVEPGAVVGHSQGEIAAAHVAGAFTLEEAARLVALRGRTMLELGGLGGLMTVFAPVDRVEPLLDAWPGRLGVAVLNGPSTVVVSGETGALDELRDLCARMNLRTKDVKSDIAGHGPQTETVKDQLLAALGPLSPRPARVPFYSTVTGGRLDTTELDAGYWYRNLRRTVRMEAATRALLAAGHRVFVESSPHPVLAGAIGETCEAAGAEDAVVLGSVRRQAGDARAFLLSAAAGWAAGLPVDWRPCFPSTARTAPPVELPTYPFQRRRYWPTAAADPVAAAAGEDSAFWDLVDDADTARLAAETGAGEPELAAVLPALADWRQRSRRRALAASWSYREVWQPVRTPAAPAPAERLVVIPATHTDDPWVAAVVTALGPGTARLDIDPATADRTTLASALPAQLPIVISLLGLAEEPGDARHPAVPAGLAATVALLQALADRPTGARLWCLTRDAVAAVPGDLVRHPVQGTLWGLGRVAALEHPALWGGLADLPDTLDPRSGALLAALLTADAPEDQLALRPSGAHARRLVPAGTPAALQPWRTSGTGSHAGRPVPAGEPAAPQSWRSDRTPVATGDNGTDARRPGPAAEPLAPQPWRTGGTVLVTGGTGALGSRLAHWVVSRGAAHVLLLSRRGADAPGADTLTKQLTELGARVTVAACDTADRAALAAHLDALPAEHPLTTVIHAAGVSDGDSETTALTPDTLQTLLGAKLLGARHLHELTADHDLDAFVLFSSGAASWGSGGQPAYAAANAYLDALAAHRRATGLPATSVAWGAWGETGMATEPGLAAELARRGVHPMDPDTALAALQRALDEDVTGLTVTATDWAAFLPAFTAARPSPLLTELAPAAEPGPTDDAEPEDGPGGLRDRLADLPDVERTRLLLDLVRTEAAATLGHSGADAVPAERALRDLGFDSVSAVDLRNRLKTVTGLALPASLVFDHPNAAAVAAHLRSELFPDAAGTTDGDDPDAAVRAALAAIPPARLRKAGLLDLILQLADGDPVTTGTPTGDGDPHAQHDLDALDGESLLRLAAETTSD